MQRFFFPFANKYPNLSKHIWHRLAIVIYWILVVFFLYEVYHLFQAPEYNELVNCYQIETEMFPGISLQSLDVRCSVFKPTTGVNLLTAIFGTLILSYIIQTLYYKIILYIVLGKRSASINE